MPFDAMIDVAVMHRRRGMHNRALLTSIVMDACRQVLELTAAEAERMGRERPA